MTILADSAERLPVEGIIVAAMLPVWVFAVFAAIVAWQAFRYFASDTQTRRRRLAVFESNFGRDNGWYVEHDGRRVGILTDCCFERMFWDSYRIEALTGDANEANQLLTDPKWWVSGKPTFRNRAWLDEIAAFALPAGDTFPEPGRVMIRGLYVQCDRDVPNLWEGLLLWWRRRKRPQ